MVLPLRTFKSILLTLLVLCGKLAGAGVDIDTSETVTTAERREGTAIQRKMEPLPILMYDTDIGFGYGAKVFLLNYFGKRESFDIILFNSTKGERWYRLVFSIPDFELRQGKRYPFAVDVVVDYDKWIKSSFFGIGAHANVDQREYFTREPFEFGATVSRGFSETFVGQGGLRYKSIRQYNFSDTSRLRQLPPALNAGTVRYISVFLSLRYDNRNSFVNPSNGFVVQGEFEHAPALIDPDVSFNRSTFRVMQYIPVRGDGLILATRAVLQHIAGTDLPIQLLLPIGGGSTLRGYPQDRYLDRLSLVTNTEVRFRLYRRLGGVAGIDAGRVASSIGDVRLSDWVWSPVVGLRYHFDTFIVRIDTGFSSESFGLYFNFGQVF
jgi:outer membrane protein assembly factor BamA